MISIFLKYKSYFNKVISFLALIFIGVWLYYKRSLLSSLSLDLLIEWSLIVVLTAALNIFFETMKWRATFNRPPAFLLLAKYVIIGIFYGMISPNRLGEYGRKIPGVSWRETVSTTFITRTLQSFPTFIFGLASLIIFFPKHNLFNYINYGTLMVVSLGVLLFIIWLFYFIRTKKFYYTILRELKLFYQKLSEINFIQAVMFSFLRYLSFVFSGYLLFLLFSPTYSYDFITIFAGVSVVYLLKTLLPVLYLSGFGVREAIAVWVFNYIGIEATVVLLSFLSLYIANHILIALVGSYFVFRKN